MAMFTDGILKEVVSLLMLIILAQPVAKIGAFVPYCCG